MLELYQHSCQELKNYIAEGKNVVAAIEEAAYEENPALFREYLSAPAAEKAIMDNQFKNMKTNARLQSKAMWYEWRSKLLDGLKDGLARFGEDFDRDDSTLKKQEALLAKYLPDLVAQYDELDAECNLQLARAAELEGPNRELLDGTRTKLVEVDAELETGKQLLQDLQNELMQKQTALDDLKERKLEYMEETKAAERVSEECRGWSTSEVAALKGMRHPNC